MRPLSSSLVVVTMLFAASREGRTAEGMETDAMVSSPFVATHHPGFGARVGGYGFRAPATGKWDDCRMQGVGVFGTLDFGRHVFVELAVDSYQAVAAAETGMDRVSVLGTSAVGLRMFPDFAVTPNVHAGGGVEWTRVEDMGARKEGLYPVGFLGLGLEANLVSSFRLGANLRMVGMAHPKEREAMKGVEGPAKGVEMEFQPASQVQLFARYVL